MSFMSLPRLIALLAMLSCASSARTVRTASAPVHEQSPFREQALDVLQAAVASESEDIRAAGFVAWLGSGDGSAESVALRAGLDPSPYVQRALAEAVPEAMGAVVGRHHDPDPLAQAWLGSAGIDVAPMSGSGSMVALSNAIGGDEAARSVLLSLVSEGDVPPEASFFRLLGRVRMEGLAQALVDGTPLSEPDVQLSMALAVLAQAHPDGSALLARVLEQTDDPLAAFQVIESLAREPVAGSMGWLQRARRSSKTEVSLYAELGLVALGELPVTRADEALQSPDRDTRAWALECIGLAHQDRPLPRDRLELLQRSTRDESPVVKEAAVRAILRAAESERVKAPLSITGAELDSVSILIAGELLARHPHHVPK